MTWELEHSVIANANRQTVWEWHSNVDNWARFEGDAVESITLDGPFQAGTHITTKMPGQEPRYSVKILADLAAGGKVLELAIGTGRVALPLVARGLPVHGIDASEAMVAKLREKPGGDAIPVTIGDFADVGVEGEYDLIFVVFNTLFNLTSQDEQVRCFRNVASHLTPRGVFVVEAYIPDLKGFAKGQAVRMVYVTTDSTILEAAVHDSAAQTVQYQYIVITTDGVQLYPVPMRYAWPGGLDLMARLAGLKLRDRWGGWDRSPLTASSSSHVSVYVRAED